MKIRVIVCLVQHLSFSTIISSSAGISYRSILCCRNRAAEKLYGYKDYEALGQRTIELLFDEEQLHSALAIMQSLSTGRCWSGQLRLRKRSGQSFMALVTKSPLYEDGELKGIVTVSSDAAVFNNTNSRIIRTNRDNAYEQSKFGKINFKRVQWHPLPQIADVPQLASSVSNLVLSITSLCFFLG